MTTETTTEVLIECHDGWNLHIGRSTGFEFVSSGVEGVSLSRAGDSHVHIPTEDIPDVIAALQRFVDADDTRPDRA
jgi:hypothetical protein